MNSSHWMVNKRTGEYLLNTDGFYDPREWQRLLCDDRGFIPWHPGDDKPVSKKYKKFVVKLRNGTQRIVDVQNTASVDWRTRDSGESVVGYRPITEPVGFKKERAEARELKKKAKAPHPCVIHTSKSDNMDGLDVVISLSERKFLNDIFGAMNEKFGTAFSVAPVDYDDEAGL